MNWACRERTETGCTLHGDVPSLLQCGLFTYRFTSHKECLHCAITYLCRPDKLSYRITDIHWCQRKVQLFIRANRCAAVSAWKCVTGYEDFLAVCDPPAPLPLQLCRPWETVPVERWVWKPSVTRAQVQEAKDILCSVNIHLMYVNTNAIVFYEF